MTARILPYRWQHASTGRPVRLPLRTRISLRVRVALWKSERWLETHPYGALAAGVVLVEYLGRERPEGE